MNQNTQNTTEGVQKDTSYGSEYLRNIRAWQKANMKAPRGTALPSVPRPGGGFNFDTSDLSDPFAEQEYETPAMGFDGPF